MWRSALPSHSGGGTSMQRTASLSHVRSCPRGCIVRAVSLRPSVDTAVRDKPREERTTMPTNGNGNGHSQNEVYPYSSSRASEQDEFHHSRDQRPSLRGIYPRGSVCAVILGGGEADSRRLYPLTDKRTLPAIPVAGNYRLIDVPISNLINSGVNKVYVLTQYNSTSLNRYLHRTYEWHGGIPLGGDGFLEVVAATQGPNEQRWADGPADAVRQWLAMFDDNLQNKFIEDVMVLPSDQVYRMDFTHLVDFHRQSHADLTIVCRPVEEKLVDHFGVVKLGEDCAIRAFEEKPKGSVAMNMSMDYEELMSFMNEPHIMSVPFSEPEPRSRTWIGSTGIYIFRREALAELLRNNKRARDFSKELIPDAIKQGMNVMAYNFPDYWVDVGGSIKEFFDFHMDLAQDNLPFCFDDGHAPFFCSGQNLPPSIMESCRLSATTVGIGCHLSHCNLHKCVIGSRAVIGAGCTIEESVIMGADYYEEERKWPRKVGPLYPHIGIGQGSSIRRAIVDKNARIGKNVQLLNLEGVHESMDRIAQGVAIRDGIIVVSKSAVVPDGTCV